MTMNSMSRTEEDVPLHRSPLRRSAFKSWHMFPTSEPEEHCEPEAGIQWHKIQEFCSKSLFGLGDNFADFFG